MMDSYTTTKKNWKLSDHWDLLVVFTKCRHCILINLINLSFLIFIIKVTCFQTHGILFAFFFTEREHDAWVKSLVCYKSYQFLHLLLHRHFLCFLFILFFFYYFAKVEICFKNGNSFGKICIFELTVLIYDQMNSLSSCWEYVMHKWGRSIICVYN